MIQVPPEPASTGTGDYLGQWLAHVRGRVRAKTYEGYEGLVRLYAVPGIGDVELTELRPLHLQSLYASLLTERDPSLSSGTVLNLHLVLTQALGQAVRWELLASNPAAGAQPPRPRRQEFTVIDAPLVARILEAVEGEPNAWWVLLDLWDEDGRSDLSLQAIVHDDGSKIEVEVEDVHPM